MSWWGSVGSWLGFDGDLDLDPDTRRSRSGIAAPPSWGDGSQLDKLFWSDVFGDLELDWAIVDRARAMGIPALKRARDILCTTLGRLPLQTLRAGEVVDPQPTWTTSTDGSSSPFHRMVWTIDDLLFYGDSLWRGQRPADPARESSNFLTLTRVPYFRWRHNEDTGRLEVDEDPNTDQDSLVYIPGFNEGILASSQTALRTAALLSAQAHSASKTPFKLELHQLTADPMPADEIDTLIARTRKALADNEGILFTNAAIQAIVHPVDAAQLLIEGRNASAVDMARIASLPAALVDATAAGASLTYETQQSRNQQAVDYGLAAYAAAVTSRLSMDDVVPRGQRTAFDLSEFTTLTPAATGAPVAD